jgi:hypothetical protein
MSGRADGNTGVFAGSGHSLQLVKSADVQMVSEDVTITPVCGAESMMHTVEFRCTFVLKNLSDKAVKIQAGFPLNRESHGPPKPLADDADKVLSHHFIARDANNTYHVRYEAADPQGKFEHIFLWDMDFAAGETKTLQVGYSLPMSYAAGTTRKLDDDPNNPPAMPEYEKPWHARIEACTVVFFSYITETGKSWAGPIEKATFRVSNNSFEYSLRKCPDYVGGNPADLPPGMEMPEEGPRIGDAVPMVDTGFVWGMKLGNVYRRISPEGWKPAYIPELPPGAPKPPYEPSGIAWTFENYKPGPPLDFVYYLTGFPETVADCDPWAKCVLGKTPAKADLLELREIVAAYFGVPPQTVSVNRLVEQQVWYNPQSKVSESQLSEPRRAVLARLTKIADDQKNVPAEERKGDGEKANRPSQPLQPYSLHPPLDRTVIEKRD